MFPLVTFRWGFWSKGLLMGMLVLGACTMPLRPAPPTHATPTLASTFTPPPPGTTARFPSSPPATPSPGSLSYTPSLGWGTFPVLSGWTLDQEQPYQVTWRSPEGQSFFRVTFQPTGRPLTGQALRRFALVMEAPWADAMDYQRRDVSFDPYRAALKAHLTWEGVPGVSQVVHLSQDSAVWSLRLFVADDEPQWEGVLETLILPGLTLNPAPAAQGPLYPLRQPYTPAPSVFTMAVPLAWSHAFDADPLSTCDTFTAPLEDASLVVVLTSGIPVTPQDAGEVTLDSLRDRYGADLHITATTPGPGDSQRWMWVTTEGGRQGITLWGTQPSLAWTLSFSAPLDAWPLYAPLFEDLLTTFALEPQASP